jgi:hypothetical protein
MFKHVYVRELVEVLTRTIRFREPVGEGYLILSFFLLRSDYMEGYVFMCRTSGQRLALRFFPP